MIKGGSGKWCGDPPEWSQKEPGSHRKTIKFSMGYSLVVTCERFCEFTEKDRWLDSIGINGGRERFRAVPEENGCNRVYKNRSTSMK